MIYIVDADRPLRDALERLLQSVGLRAMACADVAALVTVYQADGPGCVLLDVRTANGNDLESQRTLNDHGIDAPVLVIASHADVATAVTALKQGALDFIEQPFNDQMLLDGVHQALTVDAARRRARMQRQDFLNRFNELTAREQEVLRRVVVGLSNREIAEALNLSRKTVEIHRANIMRKTRAGTLSQLIRMAMAIGILKLYEPED